MRIKTRIDNYDGTHVRVTLFAGEGATLANIGNLVLRSGEYQAFVTALSLGAKAMAGRLDVVHDDEMFCRKHQGGPSGDK